jgi:cytidylate kinase
MSVITISRQFGSAGKTLGKRIADKLGYYYADEDIIERAVVEIYVSPDWKRIFEVEPTEKLKRYITMLNPFGKSLMELPLDDKERYIDGAHYVELLKLIISKIAKDDNAVIVGRGGQYILQDLATAHHILLIAEEQDRITSIENNYRVASKKAVQIIKRMAKRRANLYSHFHRSDYEDPSIYGLCLNMSRLTIDRAERLVYKLISN